MPEDDFTKTKLFRSLADVGIGAIPLLPGSTELLSRWLRGALLGGGWARSDTALGHATERRAEDWRRAATEAVLIGTLRQEDPGEHLAWVLKKQRYYVPLTKGQRRQFVARWLALYTPARAGGPGVTPFAEVTDVQVVGRDSIHTPWPATRPDETVLLYHLSDVKPRRPPIENRDGRRVPARMWSSRLALDRAEHLAHLALETAPEWRLHEQLGARAIPFTIEAGPARVEDPEDPRGRAWLRGQGWRARYGGVAGFELHAGEEEPRWIVDEEALVAAVEAVIASVTS